MAFWLAIAAIVHGELALIVGMAFYFWAPRDADLQRQLAERGPGESIDVGMVDEDTARRLLADLEREQEKAKAEEVKKEIDSIKAPGQVIDLPTPREERRPDEARFAGEHDSTVTHETKRYGKFDEKSRQGARDATAETDKPTAQARPDGRLAMREPDLGRALHNSGPLAPAAKARPAGSTYGVSDPGDAEADGALGRLGMNAPERPAGGGLPAGGAPALIPTSEQLAHVIGGGTQDALKDVDDGEETALNSKKWRFATFFNRVKKQVSEHWHPEEAYRRRDPTGVIYGHQNRYTELRIQLKADGHLANVGVGLPSGLEFLDDEAITAFKEAQPFPNPPHQLLERNGLITFSFGFLYDLNGPPQMRWFKYND
ncbi:MAG TPA: energy transducer TonB [Polyangia bacterium]|nr:energy transducer TonB [Polyangia bacterium]